MSTDEQKPCSTAKIAKRKRDIPTSVVSERTQKNTPKVEHVRSSSEITPILLPVRTRVSRSGSSTSVTL